MSVNGVGELPPDSRMLVLAEEILGALKYGKTGIIGNEIVRKSGGRNILDRLT